MGRAEAALGAVFRDFAGLPAPRNEVLVEPGLRIRLPDGVELDATRFHPPGGAPAPILLERTPYRLPWPVFGLFERSLASLGYQVVLVQCRGNFASGGQFDAIRQEAADGRAVFDWLEQQPWFTPAVGLFGPSYLGFTQYATLSYLPDWVKFMAPAVTTADFRDVLYPGGSFGLDTAFRWSRQVGVQSVTGLAGRRARRKSRGVVARAESSLPLGQGDLLLTGRPIPFLRDWLTHGEPGDPWWEWLDWRRHLPKAPPATLIAGWQDLFIDAQLADYQTLAAAGVDVRLTIGDWTHASPTAYAVAINETARMADSVLLGRDEERWAGVRLFVTGSDTWKLLPSWPPPTDGTEMFLTGGRLTPETGAEKTIRTFRYDPAHPTPSVGGGTLDGRTSGARPNAAREARTDVVTYTTEPMERATTCAGHAEVTLALETSSPYHDLFVRICDVDPAGRSVNVADGVRRFRDGHAGGTVTLRLAGMAHTFRAGHRIRLQVSGGAHPLIARNLGRGEPLDAARDLQPVDFWIQEPGQILLPMVDLDRLGPTVVVGGANAWPALRRAIKLWADRRSYPAATSRKIRPGLSIRRPARRRYG